MSCDPNCPWLGVTEGVAGADFAPLGGEGAMFQELLGRELGSRHVAFLG
jgi:hypothetical protein